VAAHPLGPPPPAHALNSLGMFAGSIASLRKFGFSCRHPTSATSLAWLRGVWCGVFLL